MNVEDGLLFFTKKEKLIYSHLEIQRRFYLNCFILRGIKEKGMLKPELQRGLPPLPTPLFYSN